MTIQLTQARVVSGSVAASGSQHTLDEATEAYFVDMGWATYVGAEPYQGGSTVPASLSTDANGNMVGIVDPVTGGVHAMLGSNIITVGNGGRVSNIADAIVLRNEASHTLLTQTTGTATGTSSGAVPVYTITTPANALTAYRDVKAVGIRIGGSGPIVRAQITAGYTLVSRYPLPADFTDAQIDVYALNHWSIALLPGTFLEDATKHHILPAFTTLAALVPRTAGIIKTSGANSTLFYSDPTQNEIRVSGLHIIDPLRHPIAGSRFMVFPTTSDNANQVLCDFMVDDCDCDSATQDIFYVAQPNEPGSDMFINSNCGGLTFRGNRMRGRFDVVYLGGARRFEFSKNHVDIVSTSVAQDSGNPTGVAYGFATTDWGYCDQVHLITDNTIACHAVGDADDGTYVYGVELRDGIAPSNMRLTVSGNRIKCRSASGIGEVSGLAVTTNISATGTPHIEFSGNTLDISTGGTATATLAASAKANVVIKRVNNTVVPGGVTTYGANTAALTTY